MLSKIRQRSWEVGQSLAGDGMLLRLRNASIALVGAVAAVGLGLTLFISQLGFPAVFNGPIPDGPATRAGNVQEAVALTDSPTVGSLSSPVRGARSAATDPEPSGRPGRGDGAKGHGGSRQIAVSPGAQKGPEPQQGPVASQPGAAPVPVAVPTALAAAPAPAAPSAPAPVVVVSPSKSSADGQPKGTADAKPKPVSPSTAKATSDGKSKDRETSKSDGSSAPVGKSTTSAEKAAKDQSTATSPKPVVPPPPAPSEKQASEATGPAAAKEAADSGKSDGTRH